MHSVARSVARKLALGRVAMAASLPQCAAAARLALPATRAELAEVCTGTPQHPADTLQHPILNPTSPLHWKSRVKAPVMVATTDAVLK